MSFSVSVSFISSISFTSFPSFTFSKIIFLQQFKQILEDFDDAIESLAADGGVVGVVAGVKHSHLSRVVHGLLAVELRVLELDDLVRKVELNPVAQELAEDLSRAQRLEVRVVLAAQLQEEPAQQHDALAAQPALKRAVEVVLVQQHLDQDHDEHEVGIAVLELADEQHALLPCVLTVARHYRYVHRQGVFSQILFRRVQALQRQIHVAFDHRHFGGGDQLDVLGVGFVAERMLNLSQFAN
mmetsp:Transcript_76704/g.166003  ORF Transcript_76704/g.166003 Transcript_76704/m.166003 type:complete len:241 (+) Transcript_76704:139-861(+)